MRFVHIVSRVLVTLIVSAAAIWGAFALWYQVPGGDALRILAVALWTVLSLAMLVALWRRRTALGLLGFSAAFAVLLVWWQQIPPSNDYIWADDVAQMTTGTVDGDRVALHNVRNFEWRSDSDYTQRWETRHYDLDHLSSVDMIMSYWSGPAIAHMLVSFGFDEVEHVVFSVEIRRKQGESFSEIGGFFKEFELSILAADERDVIRVRTNVRGEDDYLYRIKMPASAMRSLFLAYIDQANRLADTPRFYNTVTANCTTLVYHMLKRIVGYLPLSYSLLLTGYLPQYVYRIGGLASAYSFEELRARGRITERAKAADLSGSFSADIRRGIPSVEVPQ
ncbi:MAG: DUF4105 domain-containing protein [Steroidobacteraceae bacterium]|jgi:hypothetical protein